MADRIAVIEGCRTPFQRSGTTFREMMAWDIGRFAVQGVLAKSGVPAKEINHVIMGIVMADIATTNVAREAMLGAGLADTIPAHTCTVACISANMAITNGAAMIETGNADTVIAGGIESLSDVTIKVSKPYRRLILDMTMYKKPKSLGGKLKLLKGMKLLDFVTPERPKVGEYSTGLTMGATADRLAKKMGIPRIEQDEYAARSHQRSIEAFKNGKTKKEIIPVVIPGTGKAVVTDNGPRADATAEKLGKLKPVFDRRTGSVTAGNSSFLTDGASAVILMRESKAKALGLKPIAYIRSYAYTSGDLWDELLLGPAYAIPKALDMAGVAFKDVGVFEIHEAFASQMLGVIRCLGSDKFAKERLGKSGKVGEADIAKMNVYGGSLSLGHPFGATGGRLVTTCCNRLRDENAQFGLIAGCGAGAIGGAILLENAG
jgi:acetyl-CoA acetyltransferase family protein